MDRILDEVRKDYFYYSKSGGGLTLSGGEVLNQATLAAEVMKRAQEIGIHTAIETSGYGSHAALDRVLEHADLVLMDLKIMDPEAHLQHVGVPNKLILSNVRRVVEKGVPMVIRIPLIPAVTDTPENIAAIADFVTELDSSLAIHLLPYHRYGIGKYEMLDRTYQLGEVRTQADEEVAEIVAYVESRGLSCEVIR